MTHSVQFTKPHTSHLFISGLVAKRWSRSI